MISVTGGSLPTAGSERPIEAHHLAHRVAARRRGDPAAAGLRRRFDLLAAPGHADNRSSPATSTSPGAPPSRFASTFRRTSRFCRSVASDLQNTNLEQWQQDRILKNSRSGVSGVPRAHALSTPRAPSWHRAASAHRSSRFPKRGTEFGKGVTMSPITVDDDLLPTAVVGDPHHARRPASAAGSLAQISLEEMWRMVDRIRIGEQRLRAGGGIGRPAHRARQPEREAARGARRQPEGPSARAADARPRRQGAGLAGIRERQRRADAGRGRACWKRWAGRSSSNSRAARRSQVADQLQRQLMFVVVPGAAVHRGRRLLLGPVVRPADLRADARHDGGRRRPPRRAREDRRPRTNSSSSAMHSTAWRTSWWSSPRTCERKSARRCSAAWPPAWSTTCRIRSRTSATAAS